MPWKTSTSEHRARIFTADSSVTTPGYYKVTEISLAVISYTSNVRTPDIFIYTYKYSTRFTGYQDGDFKNSGVRSGSELSAFSSFSSFLLFLLVV